MLINYITVNLGYLSDNDDGSDFFAFLKRVDLHTVHNWLDCKYNTFQSRT